MLQKLRRDPSHFEEILELITETSGRHTKRGGVTFNHENDCNDERPPTRINSKHSLAVCVEDDMVEIIAACVVMYVREAAQAGYVPPPEYSSFTKELSPKADANYDQDCTLENVMYVIGIIRQETRMEYECLIIAFIYLERMDQSTNSNFRICCRNWRYSLFATLMLASKTWDDFALTNYQYSNIFSNLTLKRINRLEVDLLLMLNFTIGVSSEEFHEYYNAIHHLITASNLRRIQNKLERHVVESSATVNTSSSVSILSQSQVDRDSTQDGKELPKLNLSKIPSDRYDLSRVGGMFVLLEKDLSSHSSRSRGENGSVVSLDDSGKWSKALGAPPAQQRTSSSRFAFPTLHSNRVLPIADSEINGSLTAPANAMSGLPLTSAAFHSAPSNTVPSCTQIREKPIEEHDSMPPNSQRRRSSVLGSVTSTLSEMKNLFLSSLFKSSDRRVYVDNKSSEKEKPQYPADRIQLARTFTHSEFSMSHRYLSGKNFSSKNSTREPSGNHQKLP